MNKKKTTFFSLKWINIIKKKYREFIKFFNQKFKFYKRKLFKKLKQARVFTKSCLKKVKRKWKKNTNQKKKKFIRFWKNFVKTFYRIFKIKDVQQKLNKLFFFKLPWLSFIGKFKLLKFFRKLTKQSVTRIFSLKITKFYLSLVATFIILGFSWFIYHNIFADLPDPIDLSQRQPAMTTRILDRNGTLLYRIYQDENRTLVPLEEVSQHLINATIAIEDQTFFQHHGFSLKGISRAFFRNIQREQVEGGSTITQQLVKNRLLDPEKTLRRKIRELILAVLVEGTYSKEEILLMYLNEVSYGGLTYGVEEAAWHFFDKSAKDLTLAESALLAGLPAAPSVYSPFGPNPELSLRRKEEVLRRMVEDGYITFEEAYRASQEKIEFRPDIININAPHFVMYVKRLLADKFGETMAHQGGLEVRTSLDLNLQKQTQEIAARQIDLVTHLNITNGAVLVTNPQTGEILAMVGSRNYFDFENDGQVNVTIRPRQPGSAIKPLTYALAFEMGHNPWEFIDDSPITYQIPGSRPYSPRNYDGQFRGRVTLRQALASSYNVPAVKLLAKLGVQNLVEKGQEMGISTWSDSSRFGLSLTLGAGEVLMTDLAKVFGTFATGGYAVDLDPFIEIRDHQGDLLYRNQCFDNPESCQQLRVLDPIVSYQINDILSDDHARSSTFGLFSLLNIPQQQVAVKTGTTNDRRDNWAVGYTSDRLVGVWVGNNDNSSMSYVASGMSGASPIWNETMRLLLDPNNPHQFTLPQNLIKVKICAVTNTLPCDGCPLIVEEIFVEGEEPTQRCDPRHFFQDEEFFQPIGERDRI